MKKEESIPEIEAKLKLLTWLMEIAQQTQGAEIWRALFVEIHTRLTEKREKLERARA